MIAISVSNVEAQIIGNLDEKVLAYLRSVLSYEVPDADKARDAALARRPTSQREYMERNRMANWDGRKYLLTEKLHKFPAGLLPRVVQALSACGVELKIVDRRRSLDNVRYNPMRVTETLRDYQRAAVHAAVESCMGTVRVPTGGGKTRIGCAIMAELSRPSLFLVTRRDLLYQAIENFNHLFAWPDVGQIGDGVFRPGFVTVATVQSICAALGEKADVDEESSKAENLKNAAAHRGLVEKLLANVECVIMDEVQHVAAKTCLAVMRKCVHAKWRVGLSATDWRDDNADLVIEGAVGPRVTNVSMSDLVEAGYLVPARIKTFQMAEHEAGWMYTGERSWNKVYRHFYVENVAFHDQVADIVQAWLGNGRTVLTLVTSVEHGKRLEALCADRQLPGVFLSGVARTEQRADVLQRVRVGQLRHLIATSIADEGLDLPSLDALVLAGGGRSSTRALQRIGRVLRPAPGKTDGLVADFVSPDHEWLSNQYNRRREIYETEPAFILE